MIIVHNNAVVAQIYAYGRIGLSIDVSQKVTLLKNTIIQWILRVVSVSIK